MVFRATTEGFCLDLQLITQGSTDQINRSRTERFSPRAVRGSLTLPFWPVVWILIERDNKFYKFWNERSLTKESDIRLVILQQY